MHDRVLTPSRTAESSHRARSTRANQQDRVTSSSEPLTELPADLRMLAVEALDQVFSDRSELAEQWAEAANWSRWRQEITRLRDLLDPPIPPQEEALFEI
ncbi:DUF4259 domain-containing protein [Streptomyces sp. NPDC055632]